MRWEDLREYLVRILKEAVQSLQNNIPSFALRVMQVTSIMSEHSELTLNLEPPGM